MAKLKNYLLATASLVILVGALTLFSPAILQGRGRPRPKDVNVVNTSDNPVPVVVQNGDTNGTATELVEFIALNVDLDTTVNLFTVPTGQRLVITDVIVAGSANNIGFDNKILRNNDVVASSINVPIAFSGTYEHSYVSGIVFLEKETLSIRGGSLGDPTNWELRGFLETWPPS